jgi:predicted nucleic acid-binding protein
LSFVLDNSVAIAWCIEAERTAPVLEVLARLAETGAYAPLLWPLEAMNGLLMAERRGCFDAAKRAELVRFLADLPVELDEGTAEQAWGPAARLAAHHRLSVYDASYLELALRRQLPLATLDRDLRAAVGSLGLELLGR